jgi:hypothetical protein
MVFTQILLLKGLPLISSTTLDRRKASHANYFSITITTNDPGITGGRLRGFDAVDSAGAAPIFALTTNTRCVIGSSPMFRPPGAVWTICET